MGSTESTGLSLDDTLFIRYIIYYAPSSLTYHSFSLPPSCRILCRHLPKSKLQGWYLRLSCKKIKYFFIFLIGQLWSRGNVVSRVISMGPFLGKPHHSPPLSHTHAHSHIYAGLHSLFASQQIYAIRGRYRVEEKVSYPTRGGRGCGEEHSICIKPPHPNDHVGRTTNHNQRATARNCHLLGAIGWARYGTQNPVCLAVSVTLKDNTVGYIFDCHVLYPSPFHPKAVAVFDFGSPMGIRCT